MAKYRKGRVQERRIDDAPPQEGHIEEQLGTPGEKPQAGDCDCVERSAREGRESPASQRSRKGAKKAKKARINVVV